MIKVKIHEYSFYLFSMQSEKTGEPFRNTCLCLDFRDSERLVMRIVLSNCCTAQHQPKCIFFYYWSTLRRRWVQWKSTLRHQLLLIPGWSHLRKSIQQS